MLTQPADRALAFGRETAAGDDRVIVLANRENGTVGADVGLPTGWPAGRWTDRLSGDTFDLVDGRLKTELPARSVRILVPSNAAPR
jgi:hypothetical protein